MVGELHLEKLFADFATALQAADGERPQAVNARTKVPFQPGIGPHSETATVDLVARQLEALDTMMYQGRCQTSVAYPEIKRQKCDLCIGTEKPWDWAVEIKMLRFLGDNGKPNDNILMHILSPYRRHRSALTDCAKLMQSNFGAKKAVLIYGYDAEDWPLGPAIESFEALARLRHALSDRHSARFEGLIHPILSSGAVFGMGAVLVRSAWM